MLNQETNKGLKPQGSSNRSLLALTNCLTALSAKSAYIPYRDSLLTRLLKESLGGSASTLLLAAISPANASWEDSAASLRYVSKALYVTNDVQVKRKHVLANSGDIGQIKEKLEEENKGLREQLGTNEKQADEKVMDETAQGKKKKGAKVTTDLVSALKEQIESITMKEIKFLKEYLEQKNKFQELKNLIFSEDYDADQDQMADFDVSSRKVKDLNHAVEECTKMRLSIKEDIEYFDLHHFQKSFLLNILTEAEQRLISLWIEQDSGKLEQELQESTDIAELLKDQSGRRDQVILEQKGLLKKNKISTNIMYNLLLKTDSISSSLAGFNLDGMDFSQLLNNTEGVSSRYYNVAPLKYQQGNSTLNEVGFIREDSASITKKQQASSMAIHKVGTLGLLPNYDSSALPKNHFSSADDLDVSQVINSDRHWSSNNQSFERRSANLGNVPSEQAVQEKNIGVSLESIKRFGKHAQPGHNRRFNLDYRQSPYVQSFVYDSGQHAEAEGRRSKQRNRF